MIPPDDPAPDTHGHLLAQRFRLGELLGSGGSASVFSAFDTVASTTVALKILHPHLANAAATRSAFFREATAAGRVHHPNMAAVLATGVENIDSEPLAWIAFEFAPGVTLAEWVEDHGALPWVDALVVLEGVLLALGAAHGVGIVHRDVSPANVSVFVEPGQGITTAGIRLLDFGLADEIGRAAVGIDVLRTEADNNVGPDSGTDTADTAGAAAGVLGSVNYLSPEQAMGHPVDERGDIYQAAGVLYFALAGRPPFERGSAAAVMRAHLEALPPVPSVVVPGIPRSIDRLVVKGMLKEPSSRFASAAEMLDELRRIRAAHPGYAATALLARQTSRPATSAAPVLRAAIPTATSVRITPREPSGPAAAGRELPPRGSMPPPVTSSRAIIAGSIAAITIVVLVAIVAVMGAAGGRGPVPLGNSATPSVIATVPSAEPTDPPAVDVAVTGALNPRAVPVPDVVGQPLSDVRETISALGLVEGELLVEDSLQSADTVLGISPEPGVSVPAGSSVVLQVASGKNTVPDIAGMAQQDGINAMTSAGFLAAVTSDGQSVQRRVERTVPASGSSQSLGVTVEIVLRAVTATPTPIPVVSAPATPAATSTPTAAPTTGVTPSPAATSGAKSTPNG